MIYAQVTCAIGIMIVQCTFWWAWQCMLDGLCTGHCLLGEGDQNGQHLFGRRLHSRRYPRPATEIPEGH